MSRKTTTKMAMTSSGCRVRFDNASLVQLDQLRHQARRTKRACRLKHNANALAVGVECLDVVVQLFVIAAMAFVFRRVPQQVAVEWPDVVLRERQDGP